MSELGEQFEDDAESRAPPGTVAAFIVDVGGFEGPIDVLLALAREQKVDLAQISILKLADQYLAFIADVRKANLELAADYLVMAAWLAYLKSRLLLPDSGFDEEPTGEQLAAALAFQLRRLEAMQEAGARLMARARKGRDFFGRGAPEHFPIITTEVYQDTLYDFLKAYAEHKRRRDSSTLTIEAYELYTVEDALRRIRNMLGGSFEWESLWRFLPPDMGDGIVARSALASTLTACLELAREGKISVRQTGVFGPIYVRALPEGPGAGGAGPRA